MTTMTRAQAAARKVQAERKRLLTNPYVPYYRDDVPDLVDRNQQASVAAYALAQKLRGGR